MAHAEREDRKIVAYSEHEKNILKAMFTDQHDRIEGLYFNANKVVQKWFREQEANIPALETSEARTIPQRSWTQRFSES